MNVPTYWVRQPRVLPAAPGMHRWVWDLHYPPPDALQHEYPISAIYQDTPRLPLGPWVLPGAYVVKFTANGKTTTKPLTVKMDPRVKTPLVALREEFTLATRLAEMMRKDVDALGRAKAANDAAKVRELTALNRDLASVYGWVEGADAAPTSQVTKAIADLQARVATLAK